MFRKFSALGCLLILRDSGYIDWQLPHAKGAKVGEHSHLSLGKSGKYPEFAWDLTELYPWEKG